MRKTEKQIILVNLLYGDEERYHTMYEVPKEKLKEAVEAVKEAKRMWDEVPEDERGTIETLIENRFEELGIEDACKGYVNINLVFNC